MDVHELAYDESKGSISVWVHFWVAKTGFEVGFTENNIFLFVCDTKIPNADQLQYANLTLPKVIGGSSSAEVK